MSEETLFLEALAKTPGERAAFLDTVCAGQPELRAAVEALLAAHEAPGSLLDRSPVGLGRPVDSPADTDRPVATVRARPLVEPGLLIAGRYTLVKEIGQGGMAAVWVARQSEPLKRKVAVKLIKAGMDSRSVLARFEQERQALALMDHSNIARVLDGGLAPDGRPFFVMELVHGLPLDRFCDEARLSLRQRLELFIPICQAVQHAHQKGIIHRDLKPANILVTTLDGKPVPKVIDFGVSKAIVGKLTDETLTTQFGTVIGTLEYMAPEQAGYAGTDIDTRADIYSLGVILYELLTGLRPFDAKRLQEATWIEIIRILREEEPLRPSRRLSTEKSLPELAALRQTEPRKLIALLRGELDWVVMKCMEKQRDRRYETANGLTRDIQRYLVDEPVEARPPNASYRLGKFLRRNKGPVLAASLVLLALVGGIVGTTLGMVQAVKARDREAAQRDKAEKARDRTWLALDAMTSSVTGDSLTTQKTISEEQKRFLKEVLSHYRELAAEEANDELSRARTALAACRVSFIEYRLGRYEQALADIHPARDGFEKLVADFPNEPQYRQDLATSYNQLGLVQRELGKQPEAEKQFRKVHDIQEKLVLDFPSVAEYRRKLVRSHINLGNLLVNAGNWPEAEQQFRKALELGQKLTAEFPGVAEHREVLAVTHLNLGVLLAKLGKVSEVKPQHRMAIEEEQQHRKAVDLLEKLTADFPAVPEYREYLAASLNNLGNLLFKRMKLPEAESPFRKALGLLEKLSVEYPGVPQYQLELGKSFCNFGNLVTTEGRPNDSLVWFEKAIRILTAVYERDPRLVDAKQNLRNSRAGRARAYHLLPKYKEAIKDWDKTVELSPKAEQPAFRSLRLETLVLAGEVEEAVVEVADLTLSSNWDGREWYNFACVYALASGKVAGKKQEYTDRAMELLNTAVKAGWTDTAHMKRDTDLNALREREDFKKLIHELETKSASARKKQP